MVRYAILGLLRDGNARHGYGLLKEYRRLSGSQLSVGNVYRELQRLLADGLIEPTANPPGADTRRTPYRITEDGIAAFNAWLSGPRRGCATDYYDEMTLRACLVVQMKDPPVGEAVLDRWREELGDRRLQFDRERRSGFAAIATTTGFDPLGLLVERALKHLAVDEEFIEELRAAYRGTSTGGRSRDRTSVRQRAVR
jgi:DNA-binding PadR family transcriptional regulator